MPLEYAFGKIVGMSALSVRKQISLAGCVNKQTKGNPATPAPYKGTVTLIVPAKFGTRSVVPASTPPANQTPTQTEFGVQVGLDFWEEVNFQLTDSEIQQLADGKAIAESRMMQAVAGLAEKINDSVAELYADVYGYVGVAGTTPFGSGISEAQDASKTLYLQQCPASMRQMVLEPSAYANAGGLDAFRSFLQRGSSETVDTGHVGHALGFDWHQDLMMKTHTNANGTPTSWLVNQADHTADDTTIVIDTGSNDPVVGDVFTVAGDSQTYVVKAYSANTITYAPKAQTAWADNAALTFKGSHVANLAFHPAAFGFASRPAERSNFLKNTGQAPGLRQTITDPVSGLSFTLEVKDEYHQEGFYLSCLWGRKTVLPEFAVRVAG